MQILVRKGHWFRKWLLNTGVYAGWAIPLFYFLYSLAILWWMHHHSYDAAMQWYGRKYLTAYDIREFNSYDISYAWYQRVNSHSGTLAVVLFVILAIYLSASRRVWTWWRGCIGAIGEILRYKAGCLRKSGKTERMGLGIVLGAILAYRIYFFLSFPPDTDETWDYFNFVHQGVLASLTFYPIPNNHIFYSCCCALLDKLHLMPPMGVMRLPSMVGDLLMWFGIYCLVRKWGDWQRGLFIVAGAAFGYINSFYATQGRGYQWQGICVIVSLVAAWYAYIRPAGNGTAGDAERRRRAQACYILSAIIGFYLIPVFLYYFLALGLFAAGMLIARKDRDKLKKLALASLIIAFFTCLLYMPVILVNGWSVLADNPRVDKWAARGEWFDQLRVLSYDLKYISGYGTAGLYLMVAITMLCWILYAAGKVRGAFYTYAWPYLIASLAAIAILSIYEKTYPQERSLCVWALILNLFFVSFYYDLIRQQFARPSVLLLAVFLVLKIGGSVKILYWERFAIRSREHVRRYEDISGDLGKLALLHPATWQIFETQDWYAVYLRMFLWNNPTAGKVIGRQGNISGDILFFPVGEGGFPMPPEGYTKWTEDRKGTWEDMVDVYVANRLLRKDKMSQ